VQNFTQDINYEKNNNVTDGTKYVAHTGDGIDQQALINNSQKNCSNTQSNVVTQ